MNSISARLQQVLTQIENAASTSCKKRCEINLLAVSKTKPVEQVMAVYALGQRKFGENYLQEAVEKITHLQQDGNYDDIEWHFIGPIQSNKTRPIAEHFDWVQSIDRLKVAQRLNNQRPADMPKLNVCIQINISAEDSKSGADVQQARLLAEQVANLPNLVLRGIMAVPEKTADIDKLKSQFSQLESLYLSLQHQYNQIDTLSMGMTNDMELAIAQGSNMVRVGTAIFGARD
ncbi:YggS family pyridoxal phosphate-dependent enzyme [Moritella sp.]|uniref:YggS family pyridoxal phosphate-dependent enzyme n=1 Tax=Moritella sp. TaxID=78556 RepID=UPI001DB92E35|nr:YggS family pyridoxal phosphate-dependent enzyme [Moritella sp.]MCJ8349644.1 YggS family pyridoxal phosphate-dependent enzyme [Moritella sp.]NQZ41159.1 YggS family pyridoxal phosphate-dependent enzyme [Moritella sp.]